MIIIIHFLLEHWKKTDKLNGNQFIATTIVSTPMLKNELAMNSKLNIVKKNNPIQLRVFKNDPYLL